MKREVEERSARSEKRDRRNAAGRETPRRTIHDCHTIPVTASLNDSRHINIPSHLGHQNIAFEVLPTWDGKQMSRMSVRRLRLLGSVGVRSTNPPLGERAKERHTLMLAVYSWNYSISTKVKRYIRS